MHSCHDYIPAGANFSVCRLHIRLGTGQRSSDVYARSVFHGGVRLLDIDEGVTPKHMYATFNEAPPNFDCAVDPLDDFGDLLDDHIDATEVITPPATQPRLSQEKQLQAHSGAIVSNTRQKPATDQSVQKRKQRALDKSREAQKRFRQRQKVPAINITGVLRICSPADASNLDA